MSMHVNKRKHITIALRKMSRTLKNTIKRVVEQELAPAKLVSVELSEDVDHDGDPILRVDIVFEIEGDRLEPSKVRGLARHLREPLEALHEERFPVLSFKTKAEHSAEAA